VIPMAARKTAKAVSFEEGLKRMESIAEQMEHGDLPLDELLSLYEEGVKLSGELTQKLDAAEGRMQEVRQTRTGETVVEATDVAEQQSLLDSIEENGGSL